MQYFNNLHPKFKLNGVSYSQENLFNYAQELTGKSNFEQQIGVFIIDWLSDENLITVNTSGSTGKPKSILLQKQQMVNSAVATGDFFELKPSCKALLCLPCDYIAGKMMLVRAMILGWELDCVEPNTKPLAEIDETYDFCAMIPLQVQNSLDELSLIKKLIIGGAAVSYNLRNQIKGIPTQAFETYGMTETITHIAVRRITGDTETTFTALPSVYFKQDKRNCLVIKADKVSNNEIITNDVVTLVSKTKFNWLGRFDNVINSGGIKLNPETLESKLAAYISNSFFVASIPSVTLGQKLILVLEGETNMHLLLKTIQASSTLKKHELPKEIHTLPKFSWTENGKIQRSKTLEFVVK